MIEIWPIFAVLALGVAAVLYVIAKAVLPDRPVRPMRPPISNGRLLIVALGVVGAIALGVRIWLGPAETVPAPAAALDCSDRRFNSLQHDPERLTTEFRKCIEDLQRRMGK